jgi:hypothetical protein
VRGYVEREELYVLGGFDLVFAVWLNLGSCDGSKTLTIHFRMARKVEANARFIQCYGTYDSKERDEPRQRI